jgi:hypothetical protein
MCPVLAPHLLRAFSAFFAAATNSDVLDKQGRRYVPLISLSFLAVYGSQTC